MENKTSKNILAKINPVNAVKNGSTLASTFIALIVMILMQCVVIWINEGSFLAIFPKLLSTWLNILRNNTYTGIIALGMCFIIVSGGIDLSVGSLLCAVGGVVMYMLDESSGLLAAIGITGVPAYVITVIVALIVGLLLGELNGVLVAYGKIPPFIVTLGTMKIFRSVTQHLTQHFNPIVPSGFKQISSFKIGGEIILPVIYWIVIIVIMHILFKKTAFGRQVIAVGSNERAAKFSGINVNKVKRRVYAIGGVMCAVAAIIFVARIGSMDFANAGSGYEMDAITAVIVGGTAMSGGKGSLVGAFLGVLIISVMNNILNTLGVPTFLCDAVRGAIIIFAVLVQLLQRKNKQND